MVADLQHWYTRVNTIVLNSVMQYIHSTDPNIYTLYNTHGVSTIEYWCKHLKTVSWYGQVLPVHVGDVLDHEPPEVFEEVREAGEGPFQQLRVLGLQEGGD